MCKECGCGLPGETPVRIGARHDEHNHQLEHGDAHEHTHPHPHEHHQDSEHSHTHEDGHAAEARRNLEVRRAILEKNDRQAERNRGFFRGRGLLVLNVLSSPGSGKTTLLCETARTLGPRVRMGVIVGDLATDNDAQRLRAAGVPVVQISTGTVCHLEAEMVARAVGELQLDGLELLIVENVGNLVCPASYDLGEDIRVVLLSVTEGEDKPLKYPPVFQSADVVIMSKTDLAEACRWDRKLALHNISRVAPRARVLELSARSGEGMEAWSEFLRQRREAHRTASLVP